jgi:hypothetical protein
VECFELAEFLTDVLTGSLDYMDKVRQVDAL